MLSMASSPVLLLVAFEEDSWLDSGSRACSAISGIAGFLGSPIGSTLRLALAPLLPSSAVFSLADAKIFLGGWKLEEVEEDADSIDELRSIRTRSDFSGIFLVFDLLTAVGGSGGAIWPVAHSVESEVAVAEALAAFHVAQSAGNPSASRRLRVLICRERELERTLSDLQMFLAMNLALSSGERGDSAVGGGSMAREIYRAGGRWAAVAPLASIPLVRSASIVP
jgi:hypothetical protein